MTSPTIESLILELATKYGNANALSAPDRAPLSFAGLATLVEDTRAWLVRRGFGRGKRIGLSVSERPEMAAVFLSTACSATAVPLNPDATLAESEAQLARLRVDALVVSVSGGGASRDAAGRLGLTVFELRTRTAAGAGCFELEGGTLAETDSGERPAGQDVAFLMPTSGTTAAPKIVPITHALALKRACTEAEAFQLKPGDCCLNFRPLYLHSGLNAGLLVPLSAGGCVLLPPDFDAQRLPALLNEHRVTWFLGNPAYNEAILERFTTRDDAALRSHYLRFIRSSSYRLPPEQMTHLEHVFGVPVLERYGGKEAGIIARNPPPPGDRRPGTVGQAVDSEIAIVDDQGRRLPLGADGEIVVRGDCVIGSYEGDPIVNTESFFDDWYRTGDLGCLDDDGFQRVLDRRWDFINRGGRKISPVEVEQVLLQHAGVADAACFPVPHPTLGEEVWSAVVLDRQAPPEEADVLAFAGRYLSDAKVPRRLIVTDELPRAASRKLKRSELTRCVQRVDAT